MRSSPCCRKQPRQTLLDIPAAARQRLAAFAFLCLLFCATPLVAAGTPPQFILPVDCHIGENCFIQNYVDLIEGPGVEDHACGLLSYEGHKGTDIRVRDIRQLAKGFNVVAAASGRVVGLRDGVTDRDYRQVPPSSLKGRECGNGVMIDHGRGWKSQYCHMKRGSVKVKKGQEVQAGDTLGQMGLSGMTQFPHLHFEVLRDGRHVDPFTGLHTRPPRHCGGTALSGNLWKFSAAAKLGYRSSGMISSGFAPRKPGLADIERGVFSGNRGRTDTKSVVYWVQLYGLQAGDRMELIVVGPDQSVLTKHRKVHKGTHKAQWFSFVGKNRPENRMWPAGTYTGRFTLWRKSPVGGWKKIVADTKHLTLRKF